MSGGYALPSLMHSNHSDDNSVCARAGAAATRNAAAMVAPIRFATGLIDTFLRRAPRQIIAFCREQAARTISYQVIPLGPASPIPAGPTPEPGAQWARRSLRKRVIATLYSSSARTSEGFCGWVK